MIMLSLNMNYLIEDLLGPMGDSLLYLIGSCVAYNGIRCIIIVLLGI
jgi:hypothetical protein